MSKEEAIPLVQYINCHDNRFRAEAHFFGQSAGAEEALVVLTDRETQRPLPPLFRRDEYRKPEGCHSYFSPYDLVD